MLFFECIGRTPTVRLKRLEERYGLGFRLYAKCEMINPSGSIKDRATGAILCRLENDGALRDGARLVTATSGNFGISIAMLSASRGYRAVVVMPESASEERQKLMRAYGADVVLVSGGMTSAISRAKEITEGERNAIYLDQFENAESFNCHYIGTGRELWRDMQTEVDIFVSGVGTSGTLSGIGVFLKEQKSEVEIIAVEPSESAVLSGGIQGSHGIEGIGAGFVPPLYRRDIVDEMIGVRTEEAIECMRELARCEGIFTGISSGASLAAILKLSRTRNIKGKSVAFILADRGERYFSRGVID